MVYLPTRFLESRHISKDVGMFLKMVQEVGVPLKDFPFDRIRFVWSEKWSSQSKWFTDVTDSPTRSSFIAVQLKSGGTYKKAQEWYWTNMAASDSFRGQTLIYPIHCVHLHCRGHCCLPVVVHRADVVFMLISHIKNKRLFLTNTCVCCSSGWLGVDCWTAR